MAAWYACVTRELGRAIARCMVFALVLGMPWVLYQTWRFVAPGLYAQERRFVYVLFPLSVALTLAGIAILYFIILPLTLRFLNFYGSQARTLAAGAVVRVFGSLRHGHLGPEMVHPRYRVVAPDAPVAQALTPIYPTTAGLGQESLRRLIARALEAEALDETVPQPVLDALGLPAFGAAVRLLHHPPPDIAQTVLQGRVHPAWRRMKFDELLAQQLSMRVHYQRRRAAGAPALPVRGHLGRALLQRLRSKRRQAVSRVDVCERSGGD